MFTRLYPGTHPGDLRGYSLREISHYLSWATADDKRG